VAFLAARGGDTSRLLAHPPFMLACMRCLSYSVPSSIFPDTGQLSFPAPTADSSEWEKILPDGEWKGIPDRGARCTNNTTDCRCTHIQFIQLRFPLQMQRNLSASGLCTRRILNVLTLFLISPTLVVSLPESEHQQVRECRAVIAAPRRCARSSQPPALTKVSIPHPGRGLLSRAERCAQGPQTREPHVRLG
jgi:hypothetical protein